MSNVARKTSKARKSRNALKILCDVSWGKSILNLVHLVGANCNLFANGNVVVGGFFGKNHTLHVPISLHRFLAANAAVYRCPSRRKLFTVLTSPRRKLLKWFVGISAGAGLSVAESFASVVFIPVTQDTSLQMDISDDGRVVAGTSVIGGVSEAYRFEIGVGVTMLGDVPGGTFISYGLGMSGDGSVVVGRSRSATGPVWFRWTLSGGMISLGDAAYADDVSADGSIIVGNSRGGSATLWSAGTGITEMGPSLGFQAKEAYGVSRDGLAAVGYGLDPLGSGSDVPFIWHQGSGFTVLPPAPNARYTLGVSISDDHSVIAGFLGTQNGGARPFRWTLDGGYEDIGFLSGVSTANLLRTTGMSGDGRIIVGEGPSGIAFIWEDGIGMISASEYLKRFDINIPNINYLGAVTRDGRTFAGTTQGGSTFVATVPELGGSLNLLVCSVAIFGRRRRFATGSQ